MFLSNILVVDNLEIPKNVDVFYINALKGNYSKSNKSLLIPDQH